jgi:predicted amidohydrolase
VLFLPEAADYIASSADESLSLAQSPEQESFVSELQKSAKLSGLHINVGIHGIASENRLKNSLVWIDDRGDITQSYQKVHLFDVDIKGGPVLKEST